MATRQTRLMPPFDGYAAGQTATLRCPIGLTYHALLLFIDGPTVAQLTELRVIANGVTIHRYSAADLLKLNVYFGFPTTAEYYYISFDRAHLLQRAGMELTALGTGDPDDPTPIQTLTVEVDVAAGATTTKIEAWAIQSDPTPAGLIRKVRKFGYAIAAAGDLQISDLPKGDLINSLMIVGAPTRLRVEVNNYAVFDRTTVANRVIQANGYERVPGNADYFFDTSEYGYASDALVTAGVADLRFIATFGASDADIPVYVEYLGAPDN